MTFTVTWSEWAQQQLAAIWLASSDRNGVTRSSHEIDQTLAIDADTVGRKHSANARRYKHFPLAVEFEVNVADQLVTVIAVWEIVANAP